jgi:hypothetical protein
LTLAMIWCSDQSAFIFCAVLISGH